MPDLSSPLALTAQEQEIFDRLCIEHQLTPEQQAAILERKAANNTPLLDILGSLNLVSLEDFASTLAETTGNPYGSELMNTDFFVYDEACVRRFDPAVMARLLFVPLHEDDGLLSILTTTADDPAVQTAIEQVTGPVTLLPFIVTERDIKAVLNRIYGAEFLHRAVHHLRETNPAQSASQVITPGQKVFFAALFGLLIVGLLVDFWTTGAVLVALISILYLVSIAFKLTISLLGWRSRKRASVQTRSSDAANIPSADLPLYSILVPVYKEPSVVHHLLGALARLDYPQEKLDVLILLEEDDHETIEAAKAANPPAHFRFILVPKSLPRTKPKACNYGLNFCRGEFVTIYDAEDIPEPNQLREAVAAFRKGDEKLFCVQSALNYFNSAENYLTRMFALEYTFWFDLMLPGLDRLRLPIPLGGTSNHFRIDALRAMGAWDPFNVTEDADLGIRAAANGYRVGVIPSTTYEEANNHAPNWIRQRSRWIKGYAQTWLVHNRHPLRLMRRVGLVNWLSFNLLVGGTVWVFLMNPIMWALFIVWLLIQPGWLGAFFPGWVWTIAFISLIVGNGAAIGLNVLAVLSRPGRRMLFAFALSNPLYWSLHSIAAYKGIWQLIRKPFYWEKTNHGLTSVTSDAVLASFSPPPQAPAPA